MEALFIKWVKLNVKKSPNTQANHYKLNMAIMHLIYHQPRKKQKYPQYFRHERLDKE